MIKSLVQWRYLAWYDTAIMGGKRLLQTTFRYHTFYCRAARLGHASTVAEQGTGELESTCLAWQIVVCQLYIPSQKCCATVTCFTFL